jgi:hypothetical protein
VIAAALLTFPATAGAQAGPAAGGRMFLNVDVGAQPERHTLTTSDSFPLYEELASMTSTQPIRNGAMFDVTTGYRVRDRWGVAVGVSTFGRRSASTLVASVPDPQFFGRPKAVTSQTDNLAHRERAVHLQLVWFAPITEKMDVAVSAGPSFVRVVQELTPTATVPADTQTVIPTPVTEADTTVGANAGLESTYMFTPRVGAAMFVRYVFASVDLPAASGLRVGGVQSGFGLRLRF